MKKNLSISLRLTLLLLILCSGLYPLFIAVIGKASRGGGEGEKLMVAGKVVGYANIGQKFSEDIYFWGRPSAVDYNAAGSGGSNKGPANQDYLQQVQARIDSFLLHNPGISKNSIPAELLTASGSGLDPDISPASALVQVKRVAAARKLSVQQLQDLIAKHTERAVFGPEKVNVLKLNIALNTLNKDGR